MLLVRFECAIMQDLGGLFKNLIRIFPAEDFAILKISKIRIHLNDLYSTSRVSGRATSLVSGRNMVRKPPKNDEKPNMKAGAYGL